METQLMLAIGAIIGAVGAFIAFLQWLLAHQRIRMELFDKRMEAIVAMHRAVSEALNSRGTDDFDKLYRYGRAFNDAKFLFGKDIVTFLEDARDQVIAFKGASAEMEATREHPEQKSAYDEAVKRKWDHYSKLATFHKNLDAKVTPYVEMRQKRTRIEQWLRL